MNPEEIAPVAFDVTKRRLVKVTLDNMTRAMALLSSPNAKNDLMVERGIINNKKLDFSIYKSNPPIIEEDIPEEIRAEMDQSVPFQALPVDPITTTPAAEEEPKKKRGRKRKIDAELFNDIDEAKESNDAKDVDNGEE